MSNYRKYEGSKGMPPARPARGAHHCGLPAAVEAGVAGRAAAHHAGVSVDTIIRASNFWATERPS